MFSVQVGQQLGAAQLGAIGCDLGQQISALNLKSKRCEKDG
jgi:hypothetical protein